MTRFEANLILPANGKAKVILFFITDFIFMAAKSNWSLIGTFYWWICFIIEYLCLQRHVWFYTIHFVCFEHVESAIGVHISKDFWRKCNFLWWTNILLDNSKPYLTIVEHKWSWGSDLLSIYYDDLNLTGCWQLWIRNTILWLLPLALRGPSNVHYCWINDSHSDDPLLFDSPGRLLNCSM